MQFEFIIFRQFEIDFGGEKPAKNWRKKNIAGFSPVFRWFFTSRNPFESANSSFFVNLIFLFSLVFSRQFKLKPNISGPTIPRNWTQSGGTQKKGGHWVTQKKRGGSIPSGHSERCSPHQQVDRRSSGLNVQVYDHQEDQLFDSDSDSKPLMPPSLKRASYTKYARSTLSARRSSAR